MILYAVDSVWSEQPAVMRTPNTEQTVRVMAEDCPGIIFFFADLGMEAY